MVVSRQHDLPVHRRYHRASSDHPHQPPRTSQRDDVRQVESFNPGGSVKDRLEIAIIEDAEQRGLLKPGQTVVEAISGNTGIALAMVCAAKGYPFVAVMVETFSVERRQIMRAFGAKVVLTPGAERGTGMVRKAAELAEQHGWFLARQFENPANPAYHRQTTGRDPQRLRRQAARYVRDRLGNRRHVDWSRQILKRARPDLRIVVCEPAEAQRLSQQQDHDLGSQEQRRGSLR